MNENFKITPYVQLFVIGFLLGFLVCYTLPSRNNDPDTAITISGIKEQQHFIKDEVSNASNGIGNAQNSVQQTYGEIKQSGNLARENADRISRITEIARECQSIAERNGEIYNRFGETDKAYK